ncbi:MAG: inositol monophosphatase [Bacteroidetes bacterium GWF2_42_66]|nr:MAG: inositol monophosphatase [Bacteroidetes bacterium GWA2_42_15]OFX99934.1 MAG: inositol monophosphatase [Bacteroidetes bacterium GWE2_42_39]OFY40119.1 MAG: inositol monophosphatase [Bacteroidetes bacterium GWF2_42_66]HBL73942.1 inositol monophosphatase [Prolixibacteraceae bacterium]HCR89248.1 inositol monophosphatase [Prolixibacteraceae bacterium]
MDLEKLCFQVQEIARETGRFIADERQKFTQEDIIVKGKSDFVTYVDKTSERRIVGSLKDILPGSGFIAEEGTARDSGEKYRWVIDPLDGTTNYIHGLSPFAVSIGLMDENEVVLGVVYEISLDEMFYAWKGSKAYCNGKEIHVSSGSTTSDALIATGFPYYDFSMLPPYMAAMDFFMRNSHGMRRLGSAAADLVYVAAGRFEAFYEHALHAWDVAAGTIIVKQAGGKICDFNGGDNYVFGGEIICSNERYFNEFYSIVNKYLGTKN